MCPALPKVLNGYITPLECTQRDQEYGVNCQLTCRTGYTLKGPSYKQCTNTGHWQSSVFDWMCVGEFNCKCLKFHKEPNVRCYSAVILNNIVQVLDLLKEVVNFVDS